MTVSFAAHRHPDDKPGEPLARIRIYAGPDPQHRSFTGQITLHAWQVTDLIELLDEKKRRKTRRKLAKEVARLRDLLTANGLCATCGAPKCSHHEEP